MALIAMFDDIRNCPTEKYYEVLKRLAAAGAEPPKGQTFHVMFLDNGKMNVIDVFDTQENFDAFGAILMPIVAELGIEVGPPRVCPVENVMRG